MKKILKNLFLFSARLSGLFFLFRLATRSQARILCYHGGAIGDERHFNPKLFLSAKRFEQRMRWLARKGFQAVSLDDAVNGAAAGRGTALPVVITFDDGWYSTVATLLPVLAQMKMPSSLYLCTSYFSRGTPVPSVTARYIIWKSGRSTIRLAGLDEAVDGDYDVRSIPSREQLVARIVGWLDRRAVDGVDPCVALEQFAGLLGVRAEELNLASRRFHYMSASEIATLPQQGCSVELHGHVHHYPKGRPDLLTSDLQQCADIIRGLGLPAPTHYCYPSGAYDTGAPAVLGALGIVSATTCHAGLMPAGAADDSRRYFLPRFLDGENVSMLEFEAEMSGFSGFCRRCAAILQRMRRRIGATAAVRAVGHPLPPPQSLE